MDKQVIDLSNDDHGKAMARYHNDSFHRNGGIPTMVLACGGFVAGVLAYPLWGVAQTGTARRVLGTIFSGYAGMTVGSITAMGMLKNPNYRGYYTPEEFDILEKQVNEGVFKEIKGPSEKYRQFQS
jgi:hypothetical protein